MRRENESVRNANSPVQLNIVEDLNDGVEYMGNLQQVFFSNQITQSNQTS